MNPRSRRAALYAIGAIAILASVNALTHSYAGLYDWAVHHRLGGWQAMSWPAEIDVFLAVGELSLYVAYLDGWSVRHRVWPWATAVTGLTVSVAGNIGHIQAEHGHPVLLADRLTAAISPIAAFAGLAIGLLVLKMTRQHTARPVAGTNAPAPVLMPQPAANGAGARPVAQLGAVNGHLPVPHPNGTAATGARTGLLHDASVIYRAAAASGERISQRALARQLRGHGHRFSNGHLRQIAASAGLVPGKVALYDTRDRDVGRSPAAERGPAGCAGRVLRRVRGDPAAGPAVREQGAGLARRVHVGSGGGSGRPGRDQRRPGTAIRGQPPAEAR